jgi:hypothetical protein
MNDIDLLKSVFGAGSVGIIVLLIQISKPIIPNSKWYGWLAVVLGVMFNCLIAWGLGGVTISAMVSGLIAGLAANGSYSFGQVQQGKVVIPEKELSDLKLKAYQSEIDALKNEQILNKTSTCSENRTVPNSGTDVPK